MPAYRVYLIDLTGHVSRPPEIVEGADDQEAHNVIDHYDDHQYHDGSGKSSDQYDDDNRSDHRWYPDHAILSGASKEQLKAMLQFKF